MVVWFGGYHCKDRAVNPGGAVFENSLFCEILRKVW